MRARVTALFCATVLVAACDDTHLTSARDGLTAGAKTLVFPRTWVGYPTSRTLTLHNESLAAKELTVDAPAPFSAPVTVLLAGGSDADVAFAFVPRKPGSYTGTAVVAFGEDRLEIGLSGTAEEPPDCTAAACRLATFDPATGTCRLAEADDGTACSAPCLEHAQCVKGVCTGAPATCDDGNACTRDACDASTGCTHDAITCALPTNLCEAAICDPVQGCTTVPAPDGTRCGADSCGGANVCRAGRCELVPVPDGHPCGSETPCRALGRCSAGSCVQPAAKALQPAWSLPAPADAVVVFTGTADDDGNVYWAERRQDALTLVSVTADGLERWRAPLTGLANRFGTEGPGRIAVVGDVVVSTIQFGAVEAHRRLDGSLAWRTELTDPHMSDVGPLVAIGGRLLVRDAAPPNPVSVTSLAVLDAATGAVVASDAVEDVLPVSSADDVAYVTVRANGATRLSARTPEGVEAFALDTSFFPSAPAGRHVAGFDGLTPGVLDLDAPQGSANASQYLTDHPWHHPPLASDTFATAVATECSGACRPGTPGPLVEVRMGFDGAEGVTRLGDAGTLATAPLLLADGHALVGLSSATGVEAVLTPSGADAVRCPLSETEPLAEATALVKERWIVVNSKGIRAYAVPGWSLASHGVVSAFGSLARDGRAR